MLDLFVFCFFIMYIACGLFSPAIALGGYMWADLVQPQSITLGFATSIPFSLVMAMVCILSMILNRRQVSAPTSPILFFLILLFIVWFNITTTWATNPVPAEFKLDWATKSVGFMLIGFLVINSRASLELFLFTFIACTAYYALQVGIKSAVSGGGYGRNLIHGAVNNGLSETSTLAGVSVACIPLLFLFSKRSMLFTNTRSFKWMLTMTGVLFLICVIGTYARTGLLGLAVLSIGAIVLVKHRLRLIFAILMMLMVVYFVGGEQWRERMGTINAPAEDSSALGRIVVWRWTLDYVQSKPLGGGFDAYLDNEGVLSQYISADNSMGSVRQAPIAYHSVFFEVLGEQGYPGFLLFVTILLIAFVKLLNSMRYKVVPLTDAATSLDWLRPTSIACFLSFCCLLITYLFVSGAYRPFLYVFVITASFLARTVLDAKKESRKTVA